MCRKKRRDVAIMSGASSLRHLSRTSSCFSLSSIHCYSCWRYLLRLSFFLRYRCRCFISVPWSAPALHGLAVRLQSGFHHPLHHWMFHETVVFWLQGNLFITAIKLRKFSFLIFFWRFVYFSNKAKSAGKNGGKFKSNYVLLTALLQRLVEHLRFHHRSGQHHWRYQIGQCWLPSTFPRCSAD